MNNIWQKVIVSLLAAALVLLPLGEAAFAAAAARPAAGDVIGIIDSQLIVSKHPKFEETVRRLQQMMRQKENEAKAAIEREPNEEKKAQIFQAKRMEAAREEQQLMDPIYKDCQEAVRVIARQRNVTVVLEKSSVYFGGQDITDFVIQQLNRTR